MKIDRNKAGILGINVAQISNTINTCINGTVASLYTDPVNGNQYNILVRLSEDYRANIEDLRNNRPYDNKRTAGTARKYRRRSKKQHRPCKIDRKYQQRLIDVTANVGPGYDLGSVATAIKDQLDKIILPPGFEVKLTGNVEQQQKTFHDLLLAFGLRDSPCLCRHGFTVSIAHRSLYHYVHCAAWE